MSRNQVRQLPYWLRSLPDHTDSPQSALKSVQEDSLPQLEFPGIVHYYTSACEAAAACDELYHRLMSSPHPAVGMDMEWSVNFSAVDITRTDLLQLCPGPRECHIFHLTAMSEFPKMLRMILEDQNIVKTGMNIAGDLWRLARGFGFPAPVVIKSGSVVELNSLAKQMLNKPGQRWSLGRLVLHLTNCCLPKEASTRLSNWSRVPLYPSQLDYAALDVYASWLCYDKLREQQQQKLK